MIEGACPRCGETSRLPPRLEEALEAVRAEPGSTVVELAVVLGVSVKAANHRLDRLRTRDEVYTRGCGSAGCPFSWWVKGEGYPT